MATNLDLKIKNWRDCSIDTYYDICDIILDKTMTDAERDINLIALLCGEDADKIWEMDITDVRELMAKAAWVNKFEFNQKAKYKKLVINEKLYTIDTDLSHFTAAQYIDFQTFWAKKDLKTYMGNILACFIIPKGQKYGKDYDVAELASSIRRNIDIVTANEILFFSQRRFLNLMKALRIYLMLQMKTMKKKTREKVEPIIEARWRDIIAGCHASTWSPTQQDLLGMLASK